MFIFLDGVAPARYVGGRDSGTWWSGTKTVIELFPQHICTQICVPLVCQQGASCLLKAAVLGLHQDNATSKVDLTAPPKCTFIRNDCQISVVIRDEGWGFLFLYFVDIIFWLLIAFWLISFAQENEEIIWTSWWLHLFLSWFCKVVRMRNGTIWGFFDFFAFCFIW